MKTLFKIAKTNRNFPIIRDCILFDGNTALSTDCELYAQTTGAWNFTTPTLVDITLIKQAMCLNKKPIWDNDTLNGIKLVQSSDHLVADYPILPFLKPFEGVPLTFNGNLSEIVDRVFPAAGKNDIRYYLNGIHFDLETGTVVATDGNRLHVAHEAFTPNFAPPVPSIIVPRTVFDLVDPTKIELSNTHAKIYHNDGVILAKLIDGKFPDHARVIPNMETFKTTVPVNGAQLDAMNKIVSMNKVNNERFGLVVLQQNGQITTRNKDFTIDFCGRLQTYYGANAQYFADALKAIGNGSLHLSDSANDALLFTSGNFQAVVMPMRY